MSTWFDGASPGRVAILTGGPAASAARRPAGWRLAVTPSWSTTCTTSRPPSRSSRRSSPHVAQRLPCGPTSPDELDVERLFTETIEAFGGVDAVVHAVARRTSTARVTEVDLDEFDALWRFNTRPLLNVNREAARHVRDGGAIVNLSDAVLASTTQVYGISAATAAAADILTRLLAEELGERGITVNAVSLVTDRPCAPHRIATVVEYLLSGEGRGLTGRVIRLDESDGTGATPGRS